MARLLMDIASSAGFTAQGNSKMYRPAGLALLIGVYIVVCCLSFQLGTRVMPVTIFFMMAPT